MPDCGIGLMVKFPELGKVKTRLAGTIGDKEALNIYRKLLEHAVKITIGLDGNCIYRTAFVAPANKVSSFANYYPDFDKLFAQTGADLGARMHNALTEQLTFPQTECAILIGADIPEINSGIINQAIDLLETNNLTLGPTIDGGYYLIGMKKPIRHMFENVEWGTDRVFKQTMAIAERLELKVGITPTLRDLDEYADLEYFSQYFGGLK